MIMEAHQKIPRHIAIVMDGNGRWAQAQELPRLAGHREGVTTLKNIVKFSREAGVEVLSAFAFSTENWQRPDEEVNFLMELLLSSLEKEVDELHQEGVSLRFVGDRTCLTETIRQGMETAERLTAKNTQLTMVVAFNYGGQWDIAQAAHHFAKAVLAKQENLTDTVSVEQFAPYLSLADLPPVDLFIRTSGEERISNFFLWQAAYAEFYFTDVLWPDFDKAEFEKALQVFASRERRFGDVLAEELT